MGASLHITQLSKLHTCCTVCAIFYPIIYCPNYLPFPHALARLDGVMSYH